MKRYLPYVLFVVGLFLLGGAAWYGWHIMRPTPNGEAPATLAGLALTELTTGEEAITQVKNLHLSDFAIVDAVVAVYGSQQALVWIATAESEDAASALIADMEVSIAQGTSASPFTPVGVYNFGGRPVFQVDGLGQLNFYFQSGAKVIWISAEATLAERGVTELMGYFP